MKVEALANFPIERDLVVDMTHFIESLEAIKPYIIGPPAPRIRVLNIQTPAQMASITSSPVASTVVCATPRARSLA